MYTDPTDRSYPTLIGKLGADGRTVVPHKANRAADLYSRLDEYLKRTRTRYGYGWCVHGCVYGCVYACVLVECVCVRAC